MRRFVSFGPAVLVLVTAVVMLLLAPRTIRGVQLALVSADVAEAQAILERGTLLEQLNAETNAIERAVMPSVVHIAAVGARDWASPRASGSGWVFDNRGHIITNHHVVNGATRIRVEFNDGRVREAQLVGSDPRTDIAVLQTDAAPVIAVTRAQEGTLRPGDRVFAFGSPFGIKFSMSSGIVSGLGRSEGAGFGVGYTNFIQTDAAINPGNSGGPLVDVNGRVVGMSTAIANNRDPAPRNSDENEAPIDLQGQNAGIGFAVPIETIEAIAGQLIQYESVLRGYLGIGLGFLNSEARSMLESRGFTGGGTFVRTVPEDEPAARAGLKVGDIILSVDGRATPTSEVLRAVVSVREPGTVVDVQIWRDGDTLNIPVRLGAARDLPGRGLQYIPNSEQRSLQELQSRER